MEKKTKNIDDSLSNLTTSDFLNMLPKLLKISLVISIVFIFIVLLFYVCTFAKQSLSFDTAVWGQFGDYIGGILNPIFAFAAFFALLVTITIQLRELHYTRQNLNYAKEQMEENKKIVAEQNKSIQLQKHEQILYNMINNFNSQINHELNFVKEWKNKFIDEVKNNFTDDLINQFNILLEKYPIIHQSFYMLNPIIEYIEGHFDDDKNFYIKLLSNFISSPTILLAYIFYYEFMKDTNADRKKLLIDNNFFSRVAISFGSNKNMVYYINKYIPVHIH